jgi:chromosomal replication initiator protein
MAPRKSITAKAESAKRRQVQNILDPTYPDTNFNQIAAIWHVIAETMNVDLSIVAHNCRAAVYVMPRHIFFYLARKHTQASLREIGQYAGGRDHASVLNGIKRIQDLMTYEKPTRKLVQEIEANLHGRIPSNEDPLAKFGNVPPSLGYL